LALQKETILKYNLENPRFLKANSYRFTTSNSQTWRTAWNP